MASNLRRQQKTLWYECERELNEERAREGIADIKLVTPEDVKQSARAEQTMMVAQVGQDMIGGMYESTEVRLAKPMERAGNAPNIATMEMEIAAQHAALGEIQACVAKKVQASNQ